MPFACPVYQQGPPVNGVYTYLARYCPGTGFVPKFSDVELSLNGCRPDGTPGPGCFQVPPPVTPVNPGDSGPITALDLIPPFVISPVLGNSGLAQKMGWNDPFPSTNPGVSILNTLNVKFWDSVRFRWTAARLHLFLFHVPLPGGGQLPPHYIGTGYELAADTIPPAERDGLVVVPQSSVRSLAPCAHMVELGGHRFAAFTYQ